VYNEMFKHLHLLGGENACLKFWNTLPELILWDLKELVEKHGLAGCCEYWAPVLQEEDADCIISLNTKKKVFKISMKQCPALKILKNPYERYCEHCNILYRQVLEPLGYKFEIEYNGKGQCEITVSE